MVLKKTRRPRKAKVESEEDKNKEGKKKESSKKDKGKDVDEVGIGTSRYLALAGLEDDEDLDGHEYGAMGPVVTSPGREGAGEKLLIGNMKPTYRRDGPIKDKTDARPIYKNMKEGVGRPGGNLVRKFNNLQPDMDSDMPLISHANDPPPDSNVNMDEATGDTIVPCSLGNNSQQAAVKGTEMDLEFEVQHAIN